MKLSNKHITKKEVANRFSVCERTIGNWVQKRKISPLIVDGVVRFSEDEIKRFISQNTKIH
jgi:hypothetical protein